MASWGNQRRQERRRRREIGIALRAEFELDRPRGWAAVRALVQNVGELERARMTSSARAREKPLPRPRAAERTTSRR
ncbi:MAG: hypothetical protein ACR2KV_16800 [Solirubrobacteraceae bacterium]